MIVYARYLLSRFKRDVAGRCVPDEHVSDSFEQEQASQSDDDESREVNVTLSIDEALHGHHVFPARLDGKTWMGMPFAEVIESPKIRSSLSKESFERFRMMVGTTHEMSSRSGCLVSRKIDDPKMVWCDLLTHKDAANLAPSGASQAFPKAGALVTWETDRDHRMPRA